jgi:hypothetical protein
MTVRAQITWLVLACVPPVVAATPPECNNPQVIGGGVTLAETEFSDLATQTGGTTVRTATNGRHGYKYVCSVFPDGSAILFGSLGLFIQSGVINFVVIASSAADLVYEGIRGDKCDIVGLQNLRELDGIALDSRLASAKKSLSAYGKLRHAGEEWFAWENVRLDPKTRRTCRLGIRTKNRRVVAVSREAKDLDD